MHKQPVIIAAAAVLIMGLSACGGGGTSPSITGDASTVTPGATAPGAEVSTAPPSPTTPRVAQFGQTASWPDGLSIKVDFAGWRPASEGAAGAVEGRIALFNITVTNNSQKEVSGGLLAHPRAQAGPANEEIGTAIDYRQDIGLGSFSTVLPGESQTAKAAYGISAAQASAVRFEFSDPAFSNPPIIFKGEIPAR
jgi:hypothetical protein